MKQFAKYLALLLFAGFAYLGAQTVTSWSGRELGKKGSTAGNGHYGLPDASKGIAQFDANTAKAPIASSTTSLGQIVFANGSDAESCTGTCTPVVASGAALHLGVGNVTRSECLSI